MASPLQVGLAPLYAIADVGTFGAQEIPGLVETWVGMGVGCVQLRAKGWCDQELRTLAETCKQRLAGTEVALWINDSVGVARDIAATGVHLGQDDALPSAAKRELSAGQLVGRSTHNWDQAREADLDPAVDVVAVGPIFSTQSKENPDPEVGLVELARICASVSKPVVAIGGIDLGSCVDALRAGATSVALIGALRNTQAVPQLLSRILEYHDDFSATSA